MCTVTWFDEADGYHLFSSRDEKHTRAPAAPPRVFAARGMRWTMPFDRDGGGSWIAVNEFGLSLCLLNGASGRGRHSRGKLVAGLATRATQKDAATALRRAPLRLFAPFTLAVLEPGSSAGVYEWDGHTLCSRASRIPLLTSSSLNAAAVRSARSDLFHSVKPASAEEFIAFHASHAPERGPLPPCMHRDDAATVSFTHVHVSADSVRMTYYSGPLCRSPQRLSVHLHARHSSDRFVHARQ